MKLIPALALSALFFFAVILLSTNLLQVVLVKPSDQILKPDEVRGMGVVAGGQEFTLNFEQQNQVVAALNALKAAKNSEGAPLFFEELIIYRFDQPSWTVSGKRSNGTVFLTLKAKEKSLTFVCPEGCSLLEVLKEASYVEKP
ncbi:MAG: hypothetical protein KDK48_00650 [Chlamydiia bacterium]|nr:hypothetical protein [Chlamydiia bacterium]